MPRTTVIPPCQAFSKLLYASGIADQEQVLVGAVAPFTTQHLCWFMNGCFWNAATQQSQPCLEEDPFCIIFASLQRPVWLPTLLNSFPIPGFFSLRQS